MTSVHSAVRTLPGIRMRSSEVAVWSWPSAVEAMPLKRRSEARSRRFPSSNRRPDPGAHQTVVFFWKTSAGF